MHGVTGVLAITAHETNGVMGVYCGNHVRVSLALSERPWVGVGAAELLGSGLGRVLGSD